MLQSCWTCGRAQLAQFLEAGAPHRGPGQRGDQQEQRQRRDPDARDRVQVAPEHAAALAQARIERAGEPAGFARPPQVQARDDHDDGPAGSQFDQQRSGAPGEQFAVHGAHDFGEPRGVRHGLENGQRFGMHVHDAAGAIRRVEVYAHRVVGFARHLVDEKLRAGQRGDGRGNLGLARGARAR